MLWWCNAGLSYGDFSRSVASRELVLRLIASENRPMRISILRGTAQLKPKKAGVGQFSSIKS